MSCTADWTRGRRAPIRWATARNRPDSARWLLRADWKMVYIYHLLRKLYIWAKVVQDMSTSLLTHSIMHKEWIKRNCRRQSANDFFRQIRTARKVKIGKSPFQFIYGCFKQITEVILKIICISSSGWNNRAYNRSYQIMLGQFQKLIGSDQPCDYMSLDCPCLSLSYLFIRHTKYMCIKQYNMAVTKIWINYITLKTFI